MLRYMIQNKINDWIYDHTLEESGMTVELLFISQEDAEDHIKEHNILEGKVIEVNIEF